MGAALPLVTLVAMVEPASAADPAPSSGDGATDGAIIAGVVVDHDGQPQPDVVVQLYTTGSDGGADQLIRPVSTGADGRWRLEDLAADCYLVVVEAPAGTTFPDGATDEHEVCLDPGQADETLRSTTEPVPDPANATESAELPEARPPPGGTAALTVDLLHLGRHLGRLEPSPQRLDIAGLTVDVETGGWPRLEAALRAEAEPSTGTFGASTVLVDTGGILGPSPLSRVFGGAADAAMLNRVCFDVVAPDAGDLERDPALGTFVDFLTDGGCDTRILLPTDGATTDPAANVPGAAIRPVGPDRDGAAIAFVTATDRPGPRADAPAATAARVDRLLAGGFERIVVISALGRLADRALVATLPGVDAVLGVGSGSDDGPDYAANADGDPVCLSHTEGGTASLGHLRIGFDGAGGITDCAASTTLLLGEQVAVVDPATGRSRTPTGAERRAITRSLAEDPTRAVVPPDEAAGRALTSWGRALDVLLDEPIGAVDERYCRTSVPGRQVGLLCGTDEAVSDVLGPRTDAQQLVARAFLAAAGASGGRPTVAVVDSGNVDRTMEPGVLRRSDVYRVVAGDRTLVELDLSGTELIQVLEEGVAAAIDGDQPDPDAYPHTAGLIWRPDYGRPAGQRLGTVEVTSGPGQPAVPLDPEARYRVVTTDDLVGGPRSYPTLRTAAEEGRSRDTAIGDAEAVLAYIEDVLGGRVSLGDGP